MLALATAAVVAVSILLLANHRQKTRSGSLPQLVAELGPPSFLAAGTEVVRQRVKLLRLYVLPQDPTTVSNWNSVGQTFAVWGKTESCKRNARYFYDEMNGDSFDGWTWYSSRSPFGETVTIVNLDRVGGILSRENVRVDAVSMHLVGFVPRTAKGAPEAAMKRSRD